MVCIYCGHKTAVKNSRLQKKNNQIWRRRRCSVCNAIFTTTERAILSPDMAFKTKKGELLPFQREKLLASLFLALGGRYQHYSDAEDLTDNIIGVLLRKKAGSVINESAVVALCRKTLKRFDHSAYLRYLAEHK